MHMLHSRRKAEIEILSTTTLKDKVIHEQNPGSMKYSVHHAPSLLEYLLIKISDILEASDDRRHSPARFLCQPS